MLIKVGYIMFNNNGYTPVSANEVEVNVVKCGENEITVLGVRENVISKKQLKPG